jgi:muconate cycloisomerase
MKITQVKTTPLLVPYTKPYHWAQGVILGAGVILVEVHTDEGIVGYGESVSTPSAVAIEDFVQRAGATCIGKNPFNSARLMADAYQLLFQAYGTCSSPRFAGQVLAGLEMALWDIAGKAAGRPVHQLLGGAVHDEISYFGFAQGDTAEQVAADATALAAEGFEVIYVKVGRGDALDLDVVRAVRAAIGPDKRMRVDPNEKWSQVQSSRMTRALVEYGVEVVEQPTRCETVAALAQVRAASPISVSADQSVFNAFDAYDVCKQNAADLIVLGLHETGGLTGLLKAAHVAEAAGINICLHGLYETGITTCASNQAAATIKNLDDANQHMNRFLDWDIITGPDLTPRGGRLPVIDRPGLGFEINWDNVERAKHAHLNEK